MTGNLTHVVIELVDHLLGKITRPHPRDRRPRSRLMPTASALFAFAACAVLGGFLTRIFGSLSVALPAALTAALTLRAWREERKPAPASPTGSIAPAALPSFEVWPESLSSLVATECSSPDTPPTLEPSAVPGETETRSTPQEAGRPAMKRTISGTQLSTRIRKDG
jgi:hypothetical protein